ncbi:ACP S-malonyltransferase [Candidatus Oscillochloris fontis]|uniref:ACP S-malonyltransferase n=1 Tax=Candidatus Oscillochloris fontis TaxID=2496868 RepID=UPI00101DA66A|nr:ACP S-malonyltransferase [Candidatus Oscillochloris fontis]
MNAAWVFPGQGSQAVGMGHDLYVHSPTARAVFDQADEVLGFSLSHLCFEGPETALTATENAQPALLTVSTALVRVLEEIGGTALVRPLAVAGHSLGEYSALVAGGALDFATALRLVRRRGELMAAAHEGSMAAVIGLAQPDLEQICQQVRRGDHGETVVIANYNAPDQLVISGSAAAVAEAGQIAKECGAKRVLGLKVSAAFHSPLMQAAAEGMAHEIAHADVRDLEVPLIANVTAEVLRSAEAVRQEVVAQVTAPVRWIASVEAMLTHGCTTFVEIGPGKVLTGLVRRIAPQARLVTLSNLADIQAFVAQL